MSKYYVSGCRDDGETIVTCEDSEATFWTLYARDEEGLSQGIIDLAFREDAEAAMAVYVERDALQEQVQKLAGENVARGEIVWRLIGQYGAAGYHAVQNSLNPGQSLLYDAMQVMDKPTTDAVIREIGAKAVEGLRNHPAIGVLALGTEIEKYAAKLRAGEQP